jgi:hypothetical protein
MLLQQVGRCRLPLRVPHVSTPSTRCEYSVYHMSKPEPPQYSGAQPLRCVREEERLFHVSEYPEHQPCEYSEYQAVRSVLCEYSAQEEGSADFDADPVAPAGVRARPHNCTLTHTHTHAHTHAHTDTHRCVFLCVCKYIYININISIMYAYIEYTRTHIFSRFFMGCEAFSPFVAGPPEPSASPSDFADGSLRPRAGRSARALIISRG